ncbi:NAD-binding protein [Cristinia sonorae]|uniref:NAD-binding protein n=1 Tax=Cristinia sonorae TaxID=1940300 RepID=A0A8K0XPP7_9AGAR|nr:NAD-binding protein [Cristinia sonorae]
MRRLLSTASRDLCHSLDDHDHVTMGQSLSEVFPPKPRFSVEDIQDLSGKVIIVTGGNSGIGKETIRAFLTRNARVYMASRNEDKANAAIQELKTDTGKEAIFLPLDLANLKSVRHAAEEFMSKEKQLHILINGAGIMYLTSAPGYNEITEDGYDIQWGSNVVGPFLFIKLLIPALLEGVATSEDRTSRVVFTASRLQTQSIQYDTLQDTTGRAKMSPSQRYAQSKFASVVLSADFSRRYGERGLVSFAVNPGSIKTPLHRNSPAIYRPFASLIHHPPAMGALTQLWGTTTASGGDLKGKYLIPWARIGKPVPSSQDPEVGRRLWDWLEEQTRDK